MDDNNSILFLQILHIIQISPNYLKPSIGCFGDPVWDWLKMHKLQSSPLIWWNSVLETLNNFDSLLQQWYDMFRTTDCMVNMKTDPTTRFSGLNDIASDGRLLAANHHAPHFTWDGDWIVDNGDSTNMVHVCDWFSSLLHHQSMILRRCLLSDPNYSDIPIFCSFNNRNRESAKALLESDLSFNLLCVSGLGIEGSPITLVVTKSWLGNNTDFCSKSFLLTHEIL